MKKLFTLIALFLLCGYLLQAQTITTVVGGGSGDEPDALMALITPFHMVRHNGALYFGDIDGARVRRLNDDGSITTVAGMAGQVFKLPPMGHMATSTRLGYPAAVAFDSKDNMYFVDAAINCVFKVGTDGLISLFAGTDTSGYNGDNIPATTAMLNRPRGIAIDKDDNVYIADQYNYRVRKVDINGIITTYAGNGFFPDTASFNGVPATAVSISCEDMVIGRNDELYFCSGGRISRVDKAGVYHDWRAIGATSSGIYSIYAITADERGDIYFPFYGHIQKLDSTGHLGVLPGPGINMPTGMAIEEDGTFCFSYYNERKICKLTAADTLKLVAGGNDTIPDGAKAQNTAIGMPRAIAVDARGRLWFWEFNKLRIVDEHGAIGRYGVNLAPKALCADKAGNVYTLVAAKVLKISPDGVMTLFAGSDTAGYAGDGGLLLPPG